jgi:hypothetical protein
VALRSRAKLAVTVAMGSKSREVIYGGRIIGATIRARERRKPRRMRSVKPTEQRPSYGRSKWKPMADRRSHHPIAQCLNGGYGWSQGKCRRCETEASIPLDAIRQPRNTPMET